jgi:hypothetical protein
MARTEMQFNTALSPEQEAFVKGGEKKRKDEKKESKQESKIPSVRLITYSSKMDEEQWNALRKAAIERKIAKIPPCSQQDIINAAVADWLQKHGHLS